MSRILSAEGSSCAEMKLAGILSEKRRWHACECIFCLVIMPTKHLLHDVGEKTASVDFVVAVVINLQYRLCAVVRCNARQGLGVLFTFKTNCAISLLKDLPNSSAYSS